MRDNTHGLTLADWSGSEDFPGGVVVKKPPAKAGEAGSIHGWEDALEKEMATHASILA